MKEILIVEDERIIAEDLKISISEFGYKVVGIADNGTDAIKLAHKFKPDLILMDIKIKGSMNGIEAAGNILVDRKIPIIFITSYADNKSYNAIHNLDYSDYLLKPFSCSKLKKVIENAFQSINFRFNPDLIAQN